MKTVERIKSREADKKVERKETAPGKRNTQGFVIVEVLF